MHQQYNGPYSAAFAQISLGEVILARGDAARAVVQFRDALAGFAAAGNWANVASCLEGVASATAANHPEATVRLLGAAAMLRERFDHPRERSEDATYARTLATARERLSEDAFTQEWLAGRHLPPAEAVAEAIALATATAEARSTRPATTATLHGLTSRELEVLRLLAEGGSNRNIAETLSLSERTIENHVLHILTKLGLASCTAAAAYAIRHDLA
jgi:DNA-binding CsgD family transcriptional regulator